jgi:hypothetical protein
LSLSAKAQHPNAGNLFIDVALSKEGQELIKGFNRIPDRGDVPSDLREGTKLYSADPRWATLMRSTSKNAARFFQVSVLGAEIALRSHRSTWNFSISNSRHSAFSALCGEVSLVEVMRCTI